MRSNRGAVALIHPPIYIGVGIVAEVERRNFLHFGAADIGANRIDHAVPAAAGIERGRCRHVRTAVSDRLEPFEKFILRRVEGRLFFRRKADGERGLLPGRQRLIDEPALRLDDRGPWIAVGGMQPAAAEIKRIAGIVMDRPGPAAEPRPRLDHQTVDCGLRQPPSRGNTRRAAADDGNIGIAFHHESAQNPERRFRRNRPYTGLSWTKET